LEGGPPSFTPGLSYRALLRNTATRVARLHLPGSHRLWPPVPGEFDWHALARPQVLQPRPHKGTGLGLGPFRSPLLRTSRLISLPPGTEMFQFPGFASRRSVMTGITPSRVAPFGHLGITACVPLPRASRSLPRPSSPPCAQASPTCLPSLDYRTQPSRSTRIALRVKFSCENIISIWILSNPTIYQTSVVKQRRPARPEAKGSTIESGWTECVEAKRLRDAFPGRGQLLAIR
jgi:hypothetical protein